MIRRNLNRFVDEAKRVMDENIHIARFNDSLRNIEKLKNEYLKVSEENEQLKEYLSNLTNDNMLLSQHISFLEDIINNLKVIVSVKDLNKRNLLWYNMNYTNLLGYRHKELQELHSKEALNFYHPEDRSKIVERNRCIADTNRNRHSCIVRLKHVNGNYVTMNSDYFVLKRNPDGSLSRALEILTTVPEEE